MSISCTIGGDPFPDVIWIRPDGARLQYYNYSHPNYSVSDKGVMTITSLRTVDDGVWKLQVNNARKQNEQSLRLTVSDITTTTTTTSAISNTGTATGNTATTTSTTTSRMSTPQTSNPTIESMTTELYTVNAHRTNTGSSSVQSDDTMTIVWVSVIGGIVFTTIVIIVVYCVLSRFTGFRFFRHRRVGVESHQKEGCASIEIT
jgi:hypothetical protein